MNNWLELRISDLGSVITGKTPPTSMPEFYGGETPFLTPSDMDGRRKIDKTQRYLSKDGVMKVRSSLLPKGSVSVSCIGSDMGKAVLTCSDTVTNQQINSVIVNPNYDNLFVYYNLSGRKAEIQFLASGAAQPIMNKTDFSNLPIKVPNIHTQKAIASLLGALDDKIENNRRINETLEEMARAIFKSWFVDFDPVHAKAAGNPPAHMDAETAALFPSTFGDDGLPVGWSKVELTKYASLNSKSHTARNAPNEVWYADLAKTKYGVIESVEHYAWSDAPSRAKRILNKGDTIVGTVRPGNRSFAYIGLLDRPITGSTGFAVLTPKQKEFSEFIYCAATSDENIDRLAHLADGAAYPAVRPNIVSETLVSNSSEELIYVFHYQTCSLLNKMTSNIAENQTLAELRDALLPKLMSGEIRVADAEREVEVAV